VTARRRAFVERDGLLFKPRDRKAGTIDPEEINRLIKIMRDPEARNEFGRDAVRRAKRTRTKRTKESP
jgi:hypothetical protein